MNPHLTVKSRVTAEWIREQVKANKIPVLGKSGFDYWTLTKVNTMRYEGTFEVTVSSHEIVIDLQSQIKPLTESKTI